MRRHKLDPHYTRIGGPILVLRHSISHSGGARTKDLLEARDTASADTDSALVATFSNHFEEKCESHAFWVVSWLYQESL